MEDQNFETAIENWYNQLVPILKDKAAHVRDQLIKDSKKIDTLSEDKQLEAIQAMTAKMDSINTTNSILKGSR